MYNSCSICYNSDHSNKVINMSVFTLTEHQEGIRQQVIGALKAGEKRINVIGSAGVGKTVLAGALIEDLKRDRTLNPNFNNGLIFCTAPTNKALAVLQSKVRSEVEFKTIHSALKMAMGQPDKKTGMRKFIRVKQYGKNSNEFEYCRADVLDECSMLNTELLWYLKDYKFPIIFIGDSKQINPVGEAFSPVFMGSPIHIGTMDECNEIAQSCKHPFHIVPVPPIIRETMGEVGFVLYEEHPTFELTEIIRQGEGNPIIDLSRDIDLINFKIPRLTSEGKGYTYDNNLAGIISDLAEVNGTDEMKYLAWTNVDIDEMNKLVRERRYGNPAKIEREETIVFNSPFGSFYTNQEVKIDDMEIITDFVEVPKYDTRYNIEKIAINATDRIKMKWYRLNNKIEIVHEDSEDIFKKVITTLDTNCKTQGWPWVGFYKFKERFADIKYNHAISVHKSQGSTYKNTVINIGNINFNKNLEEKQRLLYTAITRASDLVILNNVK